MKCIPFYCNIAHELKGTRMKIKCIWVHYMIKFLWPTLSRGSSGSIVSDYGLDDRAIEVRSPTGAEDFSSSPCQWVLGVLSPGVKHGRGVMLTTHPHLVPSLSMSRSCTSSPPMHPSMACSGTALPFLHFTDVQWGHHEWPSRYHNFGLSLVCSIMSW
jgi:hypothetical protein